MENRRKRLQEPAWGWCSCRRACGNGTKGTMRDQGVGEAQSVTELAAEGGGGSREGPEPGWFRSMQCGADGVREVQVVVKNTELRSGSVGSGTSLSTSPADRGRALRAAAGWQVGAMPS